MDRSRLLSLMLGWLCLVACGAQADDKLDLRKWEFLAEIPQVSEAGAGAYCDVILTTEIFDQARVDLGDLRLIDTSGAEIPYALRVRNPDFGEEPFSSVREFNRTTANDGSIELSLDLGENPPQHNQVEVITTGIDFRRKAELEASDDGQQWRKLATRDLVHFKAKDPPPVSAKQAEDDKANATASEYEWRWLPYPPSRFRYLRLRVSKDAAVDKNGFNISTVSVRRRRDIPGEFVTLPAKLHDREATRMDDDAASSWVIELGGNRVPCRKLDLDIENDDFKRSFDLEVKGSVEWQRPADSYDFTLASEAYSYRGPASEYEESGSFHPTAVAGSQLQRRSSDPVKPIVINLDREVRATALRLKVADHSNPPLEIKAVRFVAPARQLIFARAAAAKGPLKLYLGNPRSKLPHYDFQQNLPERLDPAPERLQLGSRQKNPDYIADPLAVTERMPWLVDTVLAVACVCLGAILVSLGRTAVAQHDAQAPTP